MSGPTKKRRDRVETVAHELYLIYAEECGTERPVALDGWHTYAEFMREDWRDKARRLLKVIDDHDRTKEGR